MNWLFDLLNKGWVGSLLGIAGIAFGVYQLRRRTTGRLVVQSRGLRLIGHAATLPADVQVTYKGRVVQRVSSRRLVIWNDGRAPLLGRDISPTDRLRVEFEPGAEILNADVMKVTRAAIGFTVERHDTETNTLLLNYDFLNAGDGAVVEVLHTGARSVGEVRGTLVGQPEGPVDVGLLPPYDFDLQVTAAAYPPLEFAMRIMFKLLFGPLGRVFMTLVFILGLTMLFAAAAPQIVSQIAQAVDLPPLKADDRGFFAVLGATYALGVVPWFFMYRRRYPRALSLTRREA